MSSTTTVGQIGSKDIKWFDGVNATFTRLTSTGGLLTQTPIGYDIDVLEAYGGGTAYTQASIQAALDYVGTTRVRSVLLKPGTAWAITGNLTIPANITLVLPPGATISIATGITLTVNGRIDAGPYTIFTFTGTGAVAGLSHAFAEWFGVSSSASAANNGTYMQAAVNAMTATGGGHLVVYTPGTYSCSAKISLLSNLHLTLNEGVVWSSSGGIVVFEALGVDEVTTAVNGAHAIGATTLAVSNAGALAADDAIFVFNETADGKCDFSTLTAVATNDLTLENPLTNAWSGGATQLVYGGTTYKHDITIDGLGKIQDLTATTATILVSIQNAYRCTVKDLTLETYRSAGAGGTLVSFGQSTSSRKAAYCVMQDLKGYGNPADAFVTYYNTSHCQVVNCQPPNSTNPMYLQGDNLMVDRLKVFKGEYRTEDGKYQNLAAYNTTTVCYATADWIDLTDGFTYLRVTSVSVTVNSATNGANGCEGTLTLGNSTSYYLYIISKPDGTSAGLISASATAPTMPTGYTHKRLISGLRTNGSAELITFTQWGNLFIPTALSQIATGNAVVNFSNQDLTAYVGSLRVVAYFIAMVSNPSSGANISVRMDGASGNGSWFNYVDASTREIHADWVPASTANVVEFYIDQTSTAWYTWVGAWIIPQI